MSHLLARAAAILGLLALSLPVLTTSSTAHAFKDGFYISLGFGGSMVLDGQRGIGLEGGGCPADNGLFLWHEPPANRCVYAINAGQHDEISRTDFGGDSFALHFRLGYNILGHASLEASISGYGDTSGAFAYGAGYANFQVRWHFLKLLEVAEVVSAADRRYDADVMVGVGYAIGGYTPSQNAPGISGDDEKGWEGFDVAVGFAFKYQVQPWLSLGVDFTFLLQHFGEFIANYDDGYRSEPTDGTIGATAFIPSFTFTFHP